MAQSASELIYNWRCYPSSKCYEIDENVQFGIWRSAAAPSDTAEKNCNIGAQLQSLTCIIAPKIFWKIYFLYDFWCTQTCLFQAIFGLPMRNLTTAAVAI